MTRILIVEDNRSIAAMEANAMADAGYEVRAVSSGLAAQAALEEFQPHLVLLDYELPDTDGLSLLGGIRRGHPDLPVVMVTGADNVQLAVDALKLGVRDYLVKSREMTDQLVSVVRATLKDEAIRSELRAKEEALRRSQATARVLLDALDEPAFLVDRSGRVLSANKAAQRQYAMQPGEHHEGWVPGFGPGAGRVPMAPLLDEVQESHSQTTREVERDGRRLELTVWPVFDGQQQVDLLAVHIRDITPRWEVEESLRQSQQALEQQLTQSQKMESIGRLAGGIAHDFNNILAVITSFSELLLDRPGLGQREREHVGVILDSAGRAAALTRQLLAFSRRQVLKIEPVRLDEIVAGIDKLLRRLIGEDVALRTESAPDLRVVRADKSQLEQIIMNLAVNARDAMPSGGRLMIETCNVDLDDAYAHGHVEATAGPHVMLAVSDTGVGMDAETQQRIFEPFFTTKPTGKGTGLGLATVYGIVRQLEGSIWVYSELGHGTIFKIYLPANAEEGATADVRPERAALVSPGPANVLLIEDDPSVRSAARLILESHGYQVREADNGASAMAMLRQPAEPIDLILSDVVMPGMSAQELQEAVSALRPVPIVFMSGYTDNSIASLGILDGTRPFLNKPFSKRSLLETVGKALCRAPPGAAPAAGGD